MRSKVIVGVAIAAVLATCTIGGLAVVLGGSGEDDPPAALVVPVDPTPATHAAPKASARPDTIHEGVWSVGDDVKPGKYRVVAPLPEGAQCYWQISTDPVGQEIVSNDIPTGGRPAVTLKKGQWFKTQGCGEWVKY